MKSLRSPFKTKKGNKKDTVPPRIVTSDDDPVMEDRQDREEECTSPVDRSPTNERYTRGDVEESSVATEENALSTVREEPSMEEEERMESEEGKEAKAEEPDEATTAPIDLVVPTKATPSLDETTLDAATHTNMDGRTAFTGYSVDQIPLNFCGCFDK